MDEVIQDVERSGDELLTLCWQDECSHQQQQHWRDANQWARTCCSYIHRIKSTLETKTKHAKILTIHRPKYTFWNHEEMKISSISLYQLKILRIIRNWLIKVYKCQNTVKRIFLTNRERNAHWTQGTAANVWPLLCYF